jgi:hypothetical protein
MDVAQNNGSNENLLGIFSCRVQQYYFMYINESLDMY